MGFRRLIRGLIATSIIMGCVLPGSAQTFPTYYPTAATYNQQVVFQQFTNDLIVSGGNSWVLSGLLGLQAATSLNFAAIAPIASLTQNTLYILPDPGSSSATLALQNGSDTFSSIVLTGTTYNTTLKSVAALGQAQTVTIPDSGTTAANVVLSAGAASIGGVKTFTSVPIFPTGGISLSGTSFNATLIALAGLGQATTYTLPDPGTATDTIMTQGAAQPVTGVKTFARGTDLATIGTGTATYNPGGRLFSLSATSSSATGGATNTTYTLPANSLTTTGQAVRVKIHGTTASNSNTKACNFLWGSAPVTITLPLSTGSAKDFYADILIYRTGASAQELSVAGYANSAFIGGLTTTATATETGTIAMELNLPASTGAADVVVDEFSIYAEQ